MKNEDVKVCLGEDHNVFVGKTKTHFISSLLHVIVATSDLLHPFPNHLEIELSAAPTKPADDAWVNQPGS